MQLVHPSERSTPMADKDALRDLLVAQGIADEGAATEYVATLDAVEAKRLVDLIMSGAGGPTANLADGTGGFLAGIRKIVESRRADAELTLPAKPYTVARDVKAAAKQAHAEQIESSNEAFLDGLKLILANKRAEQIGSLAAWKGELDDEDFARTVHKTEEELTRSGDELLDTVKTSLDEQAKTTKELLEKHRDAGDE